MANTLTATLLFFTQ